MKVAFTCMNTYFDPGALAMNLAATPRSMWDPEQGKRAVEQALELAALADDAGFDYVSCSEHHYQAGMCNPNPAVLAAALTQVVHQAGIALLGPLLALNNPVRIAEEFAMLDQLSGGRFIAMPLRGRPNEFVNYNVDPEQTRGRTEEGTLLIKKALSEPAPFAWKGQYYDFPVVSVWPGPTQVPHMPLYYSANSIESATFAARNGLGGACSYYDKQNVAGFLQHYRDEARAAGWQPRPEEMLYRAFCVVGRDAAHADDLVGRFYGERSSQSGSDSAPSVEQRQNAGLGFGLLRFAGDPDSVVEQIRDFAKATGIGLFDLSFNLGHYTVEETAEQVKLFGEEVLPRLREFSVVPAG